MSLPVSIANLRAPRGLAARAVLFATSLLLVTAMVTAATIVFGAQNESARREVNIASDLTAHLATVAGNFIASGDLPGLAAFVEIPASRDSVRRVSLRDDRGRPLAAAGGSPEDEATTNRVAERVMATGAPAHLRSADGGLASGAPIIREGRRLGVAVMMWDADAYRFNALPALAPFLLILGCLTLAAIWLTARVVRRALAPLNELARYAERVAAEGHATPPIDLRTGDEIEALANALNSMMGKLDRSMRRIQEIAFVDPVTQLPNYDRFARELDFRILQARGEDEAGAVAVFELRRLSKLMQTLDAGAERDFLRVVAERLAGAVRSVEHSTRPRDKGKRSFIAARLSAAEFAVFAPGVASPADAVLFAQHVNTAFNHPFDWRGHKLTLGAACGVALAPRDGRDADCVIRRARMALGAAHADPGRLKLFTQTLDREAVARLTLEREMRSALEANEFRAYFQPKINLVNGRIEACEALARWVRPDRTIIGPSRFIPVAEESGLIGPLSDAIMREVCWKAAAWGRGGHPANVAVNVSALQFRDDRFAERVLGIVQHAGLAPQRLELEITESVVMEDPDRAMRVIRPLRDAGVRFAIDDFGCGHSNLAALSRLPFDVIKIDQQFVRALERGEQQAPAIIDMILALARTLDMEVVAEGVERRDEAIFMAGRGCDWAQGFLYGAAVSAPEFAEMLREQARAAGKAVNAA